jgi:ribonuclease III
MKDLITSLLEVENKLGYVFKDKRLLAQAFVHRSFYNENRDRVQEHNERLEFLGDAVLGLLISDYLYRNFPAQAEGKLSLLRAYLVEAGTCVKFLLKLGLASFVLLGRGERTNEGRGRETILSDLFEALLGAIYMDGGIGEVHRLFWLHFEKDVREMLDNPMRNWKAELQDYSQKKYQMPPTYIVRNETGPDHGKLFFISVQLGDKEAGQGMGASKKEAEQAAAQDALSKLFHE